jgi:hypothetical protein
MEQKKFAMAASLYFEMGSGLMASISFQKIFVLGSDVGFSMQMLRRTKEAAYCFEKAAEIQQGENAMMAIDSLKKGFECHIRHSTLRFCQSHTTISYY